MFLCLVDDCMEVNRDYQDNIHTHNQHRVSIYLGICPHSLLGSTLFNMPKKQRGA